MRRVVPQMVICQNRPGGAWKRESHAPPSNKQFITISQNSQAPHLFRSIDDQICIKDTLYAANRIFLRGKSSIAPSMAFLNWLISPAM